MKDVEKSLIPKLQDRKAYFDYLDYYSLDVKEALAQRSRTGALVKSYILETVGHSQAKIDLIYVFKELGFNVVPVDEQLFRLDDPDAGGTIGLIEMIEARHPTIYTLLDAAKSDAWVRAITTTSPWLDQVWLSAPFFKSIWSNVEQASPPYRYTRIGFEYAAAYETLENDALPSDTLTESVLDDDLDLDAHEDEPESFLRRTTRVTFVDKISNLSELMNQFEFYAPLHSMTQLRLPAAFRGGDDIYFNGKITNRTDSFLGHRQNDQYLAHRYSIATEDIEERAWIREARETTGIFGSKVAGAPFEIVFSTKLDKLTFRRWISTLKKKNNRFRLAGYFNELSDSKVQMIGVDRHLGQPLMLELTQNHVLGLLPEHTCGNSIHRLVTNIQRMVDPAAKVWIGSTAYEDIISAAFQLNKT